MASYVYIVPRPGNHEQGRQKRLIGPLLIGTELREITFLVNPVQYSVGVRRPTFHRARGKQMDRKRLTGPLLIGAE